MTELKLGDIDSINTYVIENVINDNETKDSDDNNIYYNIVVVPKLKEIKNAQIIKYLDNEYKSLSIDQKYSTNYFKLNFEFNYPPFYIRYIDGQLAEKNKRINIFVEKDYMFECGKLYETKSSLPLVFPTSSAKNLIVGEGLIDGNLLYDIIVKNLSTFEKLHRSMEEIVAEEEKESLEQDESLEQKNSLEKKIFNHLYDIGKNVSDNKIILNENKNTLKDLKEEVGEIKVDIEKIMLINGRDSASFKRLSSVAFLNHDLLKDQIIAAEAIQSSIKDVKEDTGQIKKMSGQILKELIIQKKLFINGFNNFVEKAKQASKYLTELEVDGKSKIAYKYIEKSTDQKLDEDGWLDKMIKLKDAQVDALKNSPRNNNRNRFTYFLSGLAEAGDEDLKNKITHKSNKKKYTIQEKKIFEEIISNLFIKDNNRVGLNKFVIDLGNELKNYFNGDIDKNTTNDKKSQNKISHPSDKKQKIFSALEIIMTRVNNYLKGIIDDSKTFPDSPHANPLRIDKPPPKIGGGPKQPDEDTRLILPTVRRGSKLRINTKSPDKKDKKVSGKTSPNSPPAVVYKSTLKF